MDGLFSLLLFAALFYFMMRFGCGAHMGHGGHRGGAHGGHAGHGDGREHSATVAKDPVCGMDVAPGQGYTKVHSGREYRFCSRVCLDKFEADPGRYGVIQARDAA